MVACDNQERIASEEKRKIFIGTQKAKVALEAMKSTQTKTVNEIAQEFGVHIRPKSINRKKTYWKMLVACSKANAGRSQWMPTVILIGCTPRLGS